MFKQFLKKQVSEMRPYIAEEILPSNLSISDIDKANGSPRVGDMIARSPTNHNDQWLVSEKYFNDNFMPVVPTETDDELDVHLAKDEPIDDADLEVRNQPEIASDEEVTE